MKEGYKKTELGLIPETWKVCTLSEISLGKGQYGIGAAATEYIEGEPRYLRITDIGDSSNILNNDIKGLDDENCNDYLLSEGDIVFARTGNTTGKSYVYDSNDGELVYAGFLIKFKINNKIADHRFIKYIIQSKRYWDWVNVMSTRSGQPGINSNEYGLLKIQIPSLEEQEKISYIISTVDLQIEDTHKLIEKIKELKKGLMQRLLSKGIGHKEFKKSEIGEIPLEWKVKSISEITDRVGDGLHGTPVYNDDGEYYFINGNNLINGNIIITDITKKIDLQEYIKYKKDLNKNSVLISLNGTIGNIAVYNNEEVMLGKSVGYMNFHNGINVKFMFYQLQTDRIRSFFYNELTGSTIKNLSLKTLRETKVAIATSKEQEKIVDILSSIDNQIGEYENKKEKLEALKKGLMQQLLAGKIRVV